MLQLLDLMTHFSCLLFEFLDPFRQLLNCLLVFFGFH